MYICVSTFNIHRKFLEKILRVVVFGWWVLIFVLLFSAFFIMSSFFPCN